MLEPGFVYRAGRAMDLRADVEVAVRRGSHVDPESDWQTADAAIAGFGAALELVDLGAGGGDPERVVATNVYHRAYTLGPLDRPRPSRRVEGRLIVGGEVRDAAPASKDFAELIRAVGKQLGAVGERLEAGDRLIMGRWSRCRSSPAMR